MSQTFHLCVDIRGFLRNNKFPNGFKGILKNDKGRTMSPFEAREHFLDALAAGKKVLPTCDCEGFDFQTGCPGHEEVESEKTVRLERAND